MIEGDRGRLPRALAELAGAGVDVVRLSYADFMGTDRGKDVPLSSLEREERHGVGFCRSVYATSPMGDIVPIEGGLEEGLPDVVAYPDLSTLRRLPWEPGVAHVLADLYDPDGKPSVISPRQVLAGLVERFDELGIRPVVGPELEFFLLVPDPETSKGWRRYGEATGNVYVAGRRGDPEGFLLRVLRHLDAYDIGVSAANHEFASGQFEINLRHHEAGTAADNAFRLRSAVKELARAEGKLATFMPKPFNDEGASGFHVHLSAVDEHGTPLFDDPDDPIGLSGLARNAIAGILAHAPAMAALMNPTVTSYKRLGPDTLAPWLVDWGLDNRSAMVRVPPERGDAARLELRLGDASANPYLALAATLAAVYLGIRNKLTPPEPLDGYGYDTARADRLPGELGAALDALEADEALVELLGAVFVKAFVAYKRNELGRLARYVTDWEFREYAYHL